MAYTQSKGVFTISLSEVWDRANNTQATSLIEWTNTQSNKVHLVPFLTYAKRQHNPNDTSMGNN